MIKRFLLLSLLLCVPVHAASYLVSGVSLRTTGWKQDAEGWTVITPTASGDYASRLVYVSSSEGDDDTGDGTIGTPYATIAKGYADLRDGYPDHLLLKRGDTWDEVFGTWAKSGRSQSEPMVIGAYGTGDRPRVRNATTNGISGTESNIAIISIDFHCWSRDPDNAGYDGDNQHDGMRWWGGSNILIEDCRFALWKTCLILDDYYAELKNVAIRRNVIIDSYDLSTNVDHSSGIYMYGGDGVVFEENIVDHNGWHDTVENATANLLSHNVYFSAHNNNYVVRNNIIARASSHGLQLRQGGICTGNLFINNPIHVQVGGGDVPSPTGVSAKVERNVCYGGGTINGSARGWGFAWLNTKLGGASTCSNNLLVGDAEATGQALYCNVESSNNQPQVGINDLTFANNVVYGWATANLQIHNDFVPGATGKYALNNVTVSGNQMQEPISVPFIKHDPDDFTETTYSGNTYYSSAAASGWFRVNMSTTSYADWVSNYEADADNTQISYTAATRTPATYNASIGGTETTAAFLTACRAQRKGSWDTRLTAAPVIRYMRAGFDMGD